MLHWALKSMLRQRAGFAGSACGVAAAFILVLFFEAVFKGESEQIVAYIRHADADIWVMQQGVANMHMASSFIWDWKADRIAGMDEVASVTPILYLNTVVHAGGRDWFSYVVGRRPGDTRGGPWALAAGRGNPAAGEAVIPRVLADTAGLGIGDKIAITDHSYTVTGLSEGTFSMANSVTFVAFADLADILSAAGTVSYLLVELRPGADAATVARAIEQRVDKVTAMPRMAFLRSDFNMAMQMGVEIIALMSAIGTLLAVLIIAFTAYAQVARHRRELAVIKALGLRNVQVYAGVVAQAALVTLAGFLLAAVFAVVVMPSVPLLMPEISLAVSGAAMLRLGLLAIPVAVLASLVPAWFILRIDPVSAFST